MGQFTSDVCYFPFISSCSTLLICFLNIFFVFISLLISLSIPCNLYSCRIVFISVLYWDHNSAPFPFHFAFSLFLLTSSTISFSLFFFSISSSFLFFSALSILSSSIWLAEILASSNFSSSSTSLAQDEEKEVDPLSSSFVTSFLSFLFSSAVFPVVISSLSSLWSNYLFFNPFIFILRCFERFISFSNVFILVSILLVVSRISLSFPHILFFISSMD